METSIPMAELAHDQSVTGVVTLPFVTNNNTPLSNNVSGVFQRTIHDLVFRLLNTKESFSPQEAVQLLCYGFQPPSVRICFRHY